MCLLTFIAICFLLPDRWSPGEVFSPTFECFARNETTIIGHAICPFSKDCALAWRPNRHLTDNLLHSFSKRSSWIRCHYLCVTHCFTCVRYHPRRWKRYVALCVTLHLPFLAAKSLCMALSPVDSLFNNLLLAVTIEYTSFVSQMVTAPSTFITFPTSCTEQNNYVYILKFAAINFASYPSRCIEHWCLIAKRVRGTCFDICQPMRPVCLFARVWTALFCLHKLCSIILLVFSTIPWTSIHFTLQAALLSLFSVVKLSLPLSGALLCIFWLLLGTYCAIHSQPVVMFICWLSNWLFPRPLGRNCPRRLPIAKCAIAKPKRPPSTKMSQLILCTYLFPWRWLVRLNITR